MDKSILIRSGQEFCDPPCFDSLNEEILVSPYLHLRGPSFLEIYLPFWSIEIDRERVEDEALPEFSACFENITASLSLVL